jgi:hypothetical protein
MRMGPSVECQGCCLPVLLSSAVMDGSRRMLTCPFCEHVHLWVVADVRGSDGGGDSRRTLGSSVE